MRSRRSLWWWKHDTDRVWKRGVNRAMSRVSCISLWWNYWPGWGDEHTGQLWRCEGRTLYPAKIRVKTGDDCKICKAVLFGFQNCKICKGVLFDFRRFLLIVGTKELRSSHQVEQNTMCIGWWPAILMIDRVIQVCSVYIFCRRSTQEIRKTFSRYDVSFILVYLTTSSWTKNLHTIQRKWESAEPINVHLETTNRSAYCFKNSTKIPRSTEISIWASSCGNGSPK